MCVVVPFRLAFGLEDGTALVTISAIIDVSFLIDIIVQFFSSYFDDKNLVMVATHREIAFRYLKTWFLFDVLSILPLEYMVGS